MPSTTKEVQSETGPAWEIARLYPGSWSGGSMWWGANTADERAKSALLQGFEVEVSKILEAGNV